MIPPTLVLPAPIMWGAIAAWIPLPPAVMAGVLVTTVIYAGLEHLFQVRLWVTESTSDDPLLPANYLNMNQQSS